MEDIIEKIHKEFDSAHEVLQESLAVRAETINVKDEELNKVEEDFDLFKSLTSFSFKNIPVNQEVIKRKEQIEELKEEKVHNEKFLEAVASHCKLFPFHKFLDVASLYKIIKKYNLYLGNNDFYTGDIPVKNAKDLVEFENDIQNINYSKRGGTFHERLDYNERYHSKNDGPFKSDKPLCVVETLNDGANNVYLPYYIVAPLKDFNTKGAQIIGNEIILTEKFDFKEYHSTAKKERARIKAEDPVILKPFFFKGIMLLTIVSKWGLEGNLPEFQNAIEN